MELFFYSLLSYSSLSSFGHLYAFFADCLKSEFNSRPKIKGANSSIFFCAFTIVQKYGFGNGPETYSVVNLDNFAVNKACIFVTVNLLYNTVAIR